LPWLRRAGLTLLLCGAGLQLQGCRPQKPAAADPRLAELAHENRQLRERVAAVEAEAGARAAYIESVTSTLNEIEERLAELRGRQREITVLDDAFPSLEVVETQSGALADLAAIDAELNGLRRKLKAKTAPAAVSADLQPLKKLVAAYERRIEEQKAELAALRRELGALHSRLATAEALAEEMSKDAEAARVEVDAAREQALTIRYVIAHEKDLARAGILRKRGVLGLGGKQLSFADLGPSGMESANLLKESEFILPAEAREPRLWTAHREDSYAWRKDGKRISLVVKSPEAFVLLSHVMIVSYKR
jgi:hypothetical protein